MGKINVMDIIWDYKILQSRRSLAVVAGLKKPNEHAEPTKSRTLKKKKKNPIRSHLAFLKVSLLNIVTCRTRSVLCVPRMDITNML